MTTKLLAFTGSLRKDSFNKKLIRLAADGARNAGAEVTILDLADLALPLYNADDEAAGGLPPGAKKLKRLMIDHHAFLISSPEYNSSLSAALKNAIDWASRPEPNEKPLAAFAGKVAGLMAASPGALGGLRGLITLRSILANIQVLVIPDQTTVPNAHEAFDDAGNLKDPKKLAQVHAVAARVAQVAARLNS